MSVVVSLESVVRTHTRGGETVAAVDGVSLALRAGRFYALAGPSGAGKTTLLGLLAGWDTPSAGSVVWSRGLDPSRWASVASVPQSLGLMPDLTLGDDVALAVRLGGGSPALADELASRLEVAHVLARAPRQASLGEQQRVALVRALALRPLVVLLDEPVSHQDARRASVVVSLLREAAAAGACVVASSHASVVLEAADTVVRLRNGRLER